LRYGAVGFGLNGLNILDPVANDLVVAGQPVIPPVLPDLAGVVDEEIVVQFTEALSSDPFALGILGEAEDPPPRLGRETKLSARNAGRNLPFDKIRAP
jgi:hypothetical protein